MPGVRADGVSRHNFGCKDTLWQAALARAEAEGRPLSEVIREFLEEYAGGVPDYRLLAGSLGILAGLLAVTPWFLMVIRERRRRRRPPR